MIPPGHHPYRGRRHHEQPAKGRRIHEKRIQVCRVADVREGHEREGGRSRLHPPPPVSQAGQEYGQGGKAKRGVEGAQPPYVEGRGFVRGACQPCRQPRQGAFRRVIRAVPIVPSRPDIVRLEVNEGVLPPARRQAQPSVDLAEIAIIGDPDESREQDLRRQTRGAGRPQSNAQPSLRPSGSFHEFACSVSRRAMSRWRRSNTCKRSCTSFLECVTFCSKSNSVEGTGTPKRSAV